MFITQFYFIARKTLPKSMKRKLGNTAGNVETVIGSFKKDMEIPADAQVLNRVVAWCNRADTRNGEVLSHIQRLLNASGDAYLSAAFMMANSYDFHRSRPDSLASYGTFLFPNPPTRLQVSPKRHGNALAAGLSGSIPEAFRERDPGEVEGLRLSST